MSDLRIGLISDTHGLLRTEAENYLRDCSQIIHAGDIDEPHILEKLNAIAPTTAVRGNMDLGSWANSLNYTERLQLAGWSILVVHNIDHVDLARETANLIIFGHSHRFAEEKRGNVTLINPGSAGPRRFTLPITMAILTLRESEYTLEKITLKNRA